MALTPFAAGAAVAGARAGVRSCSVHSIRDSDHRAVLAELVLPRDR